jgi:uncharacterized membrane protein YtjA (UPF0391 family)
MLRYAALFALIALVTAALAFGGAAAAGPAAVAKILFGLFLIVAFVFVVLAALGIGVRSSDKMLK